MKIADFPNEIQHHILSYLVYVKNPILCHDIRHYVTTLPRIFAYYHEIYMVQNTDPQDLDDLRWLSSDICAYMNGFYPRCLGYRQHFLDICRRSVRFRDYTNEDIVEIVDKVELRGKYALTRSIRQLYAILTPEERSDFIESLSRIYHV